MVDQWNGNGRPLPRWALILFAILAVALMFYGLATCADTEPDTPPSSPRERTNE